MPSSFVLPASIASKSWEQRAQSQSTFTLRSQNDEQLLARCQADDRAALEELLGRYKAQILGLAFRLTGNYDDASDVAAQAQMRICRGITSCRCAKTLPKWVGRIVSNVHYDMLRTNKRRRAASLDEMVEAGTDAAILEDHRPQACPQANVEQAERRSILANGIEALPDHFQSVLKLYYHEERTYDEIAIVVGVPVGTVKSRLNRAKLALQIILNPQRDALLA